MNSPEIFLMHHFKYKAKVCENILNNRFHSRRTYNGHVLTIETLGENGASSPRKLLITLAQQADTCIIGMMCKNSGAFSPTVIKKNEFQTLYETDFEATDFVNWHFQRVHKTDKDTTLILFICKAWFHLRGYMNCQNNGNLSVDSPMLSHKVP